MPLWMIYLNQFKWSIDNARAKTNDLFYAKHNYRITGNCSKIWTLKMHRLILNLSDPKIFTDHIDGNGLNNQKHNLRPCTHSENSKNIKNKGRGKYSSYKGVTIGNFIDDPSRGFSKNNRKFVAKIFVNGREFYLGAFYTEIEAAKAYDIAAIKYYGRFANLNFPI